MTLTPSIDDKSRKKKLILASCLLLVLAVAGSIIAWWKLHPRPFGIESRVAWTTSKVIGSPDAPDPFGVERIYPKLTFTKPVEIVFTPDGTRAVVAQQDGKIVSFPNDNAIAKTDSMLDVAQAGEMKKISGFRGAEVFALAFDPSFADNHYLYVSYRIVFPAKRVSDYKKHYPQNATAARVSRFAVGPNDPPAIDPSTETIMISWPGGGNGGGCIRFGADGLLYISTGDGGDAGPPDPYEAAQDVNDLRGKILRINVKRPSSNFPYSIPGENPFRDAHSARHEIFACGLRNPARFSFDSNTNQLWVGDMGWNLWESIHRVENGGNYGWSIMEGPQPVYPTRRRGPAPIGAPELALPHTQAAALIGGMVYHGKRLEELQGQYIFGDSESRRLFAAAVGEKPSAESVPPVAGTNLGSYQIIAQTDLKIAAFNENVDGEICLVDSEGGGIWRIVKNRAAAGKPHFPHRLSETGLFADAAKMRPSPGVLPFNVNAAQWVDGSSSDRFVAIPGAENVIDSNEGKRVFPANAVFARTLSLPRVAADLATLRKIETQLLHFDGGRWHGYSYQWNDEQTDAALVPADGRDLELTFTDPAARGGKRKQTWHFLSRDQCMACHNKSTGHVVGFNEMNLDRTEQYHTDTHGLVADNQLRSFRHIGLIPEPRPQPAGSGATSESPAPVILLDPYDEDPKLTLDERARSWLHINCSVCHRHGGGSASTFDARRELMLPDTHLVADAMLGSFDLPDSQIVCPGDPTRSVLYYRMAKSGAGRMPHMGSALIDEKGLELIAKWITSLHGTIGGARLSDETRQSHDRQGDAMQKLRSAIPGPVAMAAIDKMLKSPDGTETPDGGLRLLMALQDGRIPASLRPLIVERAMQPGGSENMRDLFIRFAPEGTRATTMPQTRPIIGPQTRPNTKKVGRGGV
jgi:glucose/arabinose dehydrogenase